MLIGKCISKVTIVNVHIYMYIVFADKVNYFFIFWHKSLKDISFIIIWIPFLNNCFPLVLFILSDIILFDIIAVHGTFNQTVFS